MFPRSDLSVAVKGTKKRLTNKAVESSHDIEEKHGFVRKMR